MVATQNRMTRFARKHLDIRAALCLTLLLGTAAQAQDAPLIILVQPTQREEATRRAFQPLADYLAAATGARFSVTSTPNFLAHWETVRRNSGYDLVLDDAHFTDYRVQKFRFQVLARAAGTTSYSLAVARGARPRDPLELAGKKVASFGPPSIGATRLNAIFPNPSRRPAIIEVASSADGLELLAQGKVAAAMLPTAELAEAIDQNRVNVIITAEPTPNMALSASPRLTPQLREKIRAALLRLDRTNPGHELLRDTRIERFEPASAADYAGQARILRDTWGY